MLDRVVNQSRMASLVLAILTSVIVPLPVFAQSADPGVVADLVIQVQELQDEVRTLSGRVEEQARELDNIKKRQRDQYLDLDQRITELSGTGPASPPAEESAAGPEANVQAANEVVTDAPAADVPEVRGPMDTPSDTVALSEPKVESQSAAVSSEEEKQAYDEAFQSLKDLRYADAAEQFQAFLTSYPNSEYADNAQYWLGESYYVTRNYDLALTAFNDLIDKYPDSGKVPDALLKIGYTYYELKQWDSARTALTRVQQDYPDTTLARLAESRLRGMRMEGHY
jgi:tol-pal system protein YbgF